MQDQSDGVGIPVFSISSKATKNQPRSNSLRMQIPASMKAFLGIEEGSVLEIALLVENGKHVARIVKREERT
ncbi:MAG: hypothetical protein HRF40_05455 [Nitrososphaera sp.]|jgi:antitoxin component of MazEF toxin-antitoxin module